MMFLTDHAINPFTQAGLYSAAWPCPLEDGRSSLLMSRGMLGTLSIIHWVKLLQPFSQHTRDQQVSSYCHSFITIIWSYGSKETPVGLLYAEKMAVVVLLSVLWKGFSASPLSYKFIIWHTLKLIQLVPLLKLLLLPTPIIHRGLIKVSINVQCSKKNHYYFQQHQVEVVYVGLKDI